MLNIFAEAVYLGTRPGTTDQRREPLAKFHEYNAKRLSVQPQTTKR